MLYYVIFLKCFYVKEKRLQNQKKKFQVVIELLLFEAIKRNGTLLQPTEMITEFYFWKKYFSSCKNLMASE